MLYYYSYRTFGCTNYPFVFHFSDRDLRRILLSTATEYDVDYDLMCDLFGESASGVPPLHKNSDAAVRTVGIFSISFWYSNATTDSTEFGEQRPCQIVILVIVIAPHVCSIHCCIVP